MADPKTTSIGMEIFIETGVDVSSATTLHIRYTKPDDSIGFFVATDKTVGTKIGCFYLTNSATDIDQAGNWTFQVYAEGPGYELYGNKVKQKFIDQMPGF